MVPFTMKCGGSKAFNCMFIKLRVRLLILLCISALFACGKYRSQPVYLDNCSNNVTQCVVDTSTPKEETAFCSQSTAVWAYRANKYLVTKNSDGYYIPGVVPRPGLAQSWQSCRRFNTENKLIEGEYALTAHHYEPFITFQGNLCRSNLTINVHRHRDDWLLRHGKFPKSSAVQHNPEKYTDPAYPFYVNSQAHAFFEVNQLDRTLDNIARLVKKQCGHFPEILNVKGRLVDNESYQYYEFYSGKIITNTRPFTIVHDNPEIAKELVEVAVARKEKQYNRMFASKERLRRKRERAQQGALLLFMGAFGLYTSSPCNDPGIPNNEKAYDCQ